MTIEHDAETDTLMVRLREGVQIVDSLEEPEGVILDYDASGVLVSIEILNASRYVGEPGTIEIRRAG